MHLKVLQRTLMKTAIVMLFLNGFDWEKVVGSVFDL